MSFETAHVESRSRAVRPAGRPVDVCLAAVPEAARDPHPDGGGFGLPIVEALAHAWGVSRDGHTRVWVELICCPATDELQA